MLPTWSLLFCCAAIMTSCSDRGQVRTISLNGQWQIEATSLGAQRPTSFTHSIPVPGLVDMALPQLINPNAQVKDTLYWYRRTFELDHKGYDIAELNILRSSYRTSVYVNGEFVGENPYNFTAATFDIKPYLKSKGENEIVVKIGCFNNVPDSIINGRDNERYLYHSGLWDDVFIKLANYPYITNIQHAPDIKNQTLRVVARVKTKDGKVPGRLKYSVAEQSGDIFVQGDTGDASFEREGDEWKVDFTVPMKGARLWSPEDPFLYELSVSGDANTRSAMIGMRTFRFDTPTGMAVLNDKPVFLTGTSIDFSRFMEDPLRGNLAWDREWVTKLLTGFKDNYWTCFRSVVGFMPEFWYDICDSVGLMIFDEYDIWGGVGKPEMMTQTAEQVAQEYRIWMRERWNHPSVIVWDAQNETITQQTGKAINMVRSLDMQDRPWDNGFAPPAAYTDCKETHPYFFLDFHNPAVPVPKEDFAKWAYSKERFPENGPDQWMPNPSGERYPNATIINEYAALWVNRDGSATPVTEVFFNRIFGGDTLTADQRREIYNRHLGMQTEYWRETRKIAGMIHFQALAYSRPFEPKGVTSDNFIDLVSQTYDPYFLKYARPSFAPVGLMIKDFEPERRKGAVIQIPVAVYNDTYGDYGGDVKLFFMQGDKSIGEGATQSVKVGVNGKQMLQFDIKVPQAPGKYDLVAQLDFNGEQIRSYRQVKVK